MRVLVHYPAPTDSVLPDAVFWVGADGRLQSTIAEMTPELGLSREFLYTKPPTTPWDAMFDYLPEKSGSSSWLTYDAVAASPAELLALLRKPAQRARSKAA